MHAFDIARRIDHHTTLRLSGGDLVKAMPQAFVKTRIEPLETIRIAGALGRPGEPFRDRHIQDQSEIGREIPERKMVQRLQFRDRQTAPIPLISERRIGKPVTDNPQAAPERRLDQPRHMLAPRRVEQESFADRVPALLGAFEQQSPDRLGSLRATRLACAFGRDSGARQGRHQEIELGRLAGPLPALDRDEAAARRRPRFAQCQPLQIRCAAAMATRPSAPMRPTSAPATSVASADGISGTVTITLPTGCPFLTSTGTGFSKETLTFMSRRALRGIVTMRLLSTVSGTFASEPSQTSASSPLSPFATNWALSISRN